MADLRHKLTVLADAAKYDASCASSGAKRGNGGKGIGNSDGTGICHSYTPDGRCVSLLKILLTNHCLYDCRYCINRASNDIPRARFTVEEVVQLTLDFYRRNYIEGLFLSSGIVGTSDGTMAQMTEVARQLREVHHYRGYIHLKAVAGASPEAVAEAGRHADRVSANIELPTEQDLRKLAPDKSSALTEATMAKLKTGIDVGKARRKEGARSAAAKAELAGTAFAPAGQSTQMIVGATPSTDADVLRTADRLYHRHRLKRVYYTAYSPIPVAHPSLPEKRPPLVREHRLYQADWLMRFYGFGIDEIVTPDVSNLDLEIDPKTAWALRNRSVFPIDLNRDPRPLLLRVPGLGVKNVNRILGIRRRRTIRRSDLKTLRVPRRALAFVVTADDRCDTRLLDADPQRLRDHILGRPAQLSLFAA